MWEMAPPPVIRSRCLRLVVAGLVFSGMVVRASEKAEAEPRKFYAHYMGCYPVAYGPTLFHRDIEAATIRHDRKMSRTALSWRNYPLIPPGLSLTLEQSMDLEMRRAMRAGVDGFAVDMWAGGEDVCKRVVDAMFKVAEEKDYPFEISLCYDGEKRSLEGLKWLLATHGASPKLARHDGKPLILSYNSLRHVIDDAAESLGIKADAAGRASEELRTTERGWQAFADSYRKKESILGQPCVWEFEIQCFFANVRGHSEKDLDLSLLPQAAALLGRNGLYVGGFLRVSNEEAVADAVTQAGGGWVQPVYFQYDNAVNGFTYGCSFEGTSDLRLNWERARKYHSPFLQFTTWNDYTESTNLAPGYQLHYSIYDLNAYFVKWWKQGRPPEITDDRIYVTYRRYPADAKVFPFADRPYASKPSVLEICTLLQAPARVVVPGRDGGYDAPAGLFIKTLPLVAGPVEVRVEREGSVVCHLLSPEPITDRPFRDQLGMVSYSTEEERNWRADFGDVPMPTFSEYGDDDGDGLPNWFEMYWFGKFLDWSTVRVADPAADPDGDGQSNLTEFRNQTDPTHANPAPSR